MGDNQQGKPALVARAAPTGSDERTTPKDKSSSAQQLSLFAGISPTDCTKIVAAAHERDFDRRQTIFFEGDPIRQVLLLMSGCAKVTQLGHSGNEVILRLNGPGDLVGALGFLSRSNHCATAQALSSCKVLAWEVSVFESVSERFPVLRRNTARLLADHLEELEQRFREIATEKVGIRVAHELVRLLKQVGHRVNGAMEVSLSREELAQMTGTTLFTISRLLSDWEARGFVSPRRAAVLVRDPQALQDLNDE
jgi:CRP/FNR family transcriptional regulator, nitrogen oxide reductase regulator